MTKDQTNTPEKSLKEAPDLSMLSELDFGPSWTEKSSGQKSSKQSYGQKLRTKSSESDEWHSRRNASGKTGFKRNPGSRDDGGRKTFSKERQRNRDSSHHSDFQPTIHVSIYPQDDMFEALIKRLRLTLRTYELFEIIHLILEKPERYVIVVQNKAKKGEKPEPLYFTVADHLPFESEAAAINHFLNNHLESLFDIEQIDVEAPKGNFQMVNRCTITGELLGPPNYHRYQEFLKRHYAAKIDGMSFDHFVSKVESVKDQESINAWVESMKKGVRYRLKEPKSGEPESFESLEAVKTFLLHNRKDEIIGSGESVRFAGRDFAHLPEGSIRRSIEMYIEHQLRFPLDTANNIRGRLRRNHFTVYKKGSKGIAYVCSVKRKFRDSKTVFTPSIQKVIDFIEKNPNVLASELSEKVLGMAVKRQDLVKLEMAEGKPATEESNTSGDSSEAVVPEEESEIQETQKTAEVVETASTHASDLTYLKPQAELSDDELKRLNQLIFDLRWLITEGYVIEYCDGSLFAPPPIPDPKQKDIPEEPASDGKPELM